MLKVTFKNALGDSIEMSSTFPYLLKRYSGFSGNEVTTQMAQGFNQNGMYYHGTLDGVRTLNMTVCFNYSSELECKEKQKYITRIFNPRLGMGQITYEDDTGKYMIDAVVVVKPEIYKTSEDSIMMSRSFDVVLSCPKPDWLTESKQIKMVDVVGGLTFGLAFPIKFGDRSGDGRITYKGDNPASVILDFRVIDGGDDVENPRVENHLGEYIQVKKTLRANQKILVDTNPDAPSITFVDEYGTEFDEWESLEFGSTFFQLYIDKYESERGLNVFKFTASNGDPEVYLNYREHYAGV